MAGPGRRAQGKAGFGRGLVAALAGLLLLGSADALAEGLARRLERGTGGDYDPARAAALYCVGAQGGDAQAAFALGRLYLAGRGVPRNAAMGAAWLRQAARLGHREARQLAPAVGVAALPSPSCKGVRRGVPGGEPPAAIAVLAHRQAERKGVDPALVLALMRIESGFQVRAVSPKGAMGLMQLMPGTAKRFGVADAYDAEQNIRGGTAYLRFLLDRYEGDVTLAAAAYNAGEGAVDTHGGVPPYAETQAYVQALRAIYPHRQHPVEEIVRRTAG